MRKGKISLENVSGGELTSAPLLSTPSRYSRLLQNYYINSEGHITKIPGYSAISQNIPNIKISSGINFKKEDGTSIKILGGILDSGANYNTILYTPPTSAPAAVFSGSGLNDYESGGTYVGTGNATYEIEIESQGYDHGVMEIVRWRKNSGAWNYFTFADYTGPFTKSLSDGVTVLIPNAFGHTTGDKWTITIVSPGVDDVTPAGTCTLAGGATFEVVIDSLGTPDKFKWRRGTGAWSAATNITGSAQNLSDGISITFLATTGHATGGKWAITSQSITGAMYRLDGGNLSVIKSGFSTTDPIFMGQVGDIVVAANYVDRPVAYDGSTFQNVNLPFGNSTVFTGVGLDDFTAKVSFAYSNAVYVVEVDSIAEANPAITFSGTGGHNDLTAPTPNYSGAVATASFDVEIDAQGTKDTFKYNINGGMFVTGVDCNTTVATANVAGGVHVKANSSTGHNLNDITEIQITGITPGPLGTSTGTYKYRLNGGAWSADTAIGKYPTYSGTGGTWSVACDDIGVLVVGDIYSLQCDGASSPDTFKWRKDAETYTTGVPIVSGNILLKEGVSVKFDYATGHGLGSPGSGNSWSFGVSRDTVKFTKDGTELAAGQIITGEWQTIEAGVQVRLSSINGHTLGDLWTMPIDQSVRFGKLYPYKNRLWAIGSDKLTAYYSALLAPTDFVGEGSGYIDFRYVIPQGDELVDIGSLMNYIVFFFKNHIVIYAGSDPTAEGDFVIYQNIDGTGLIAPNTIINVGSDIFFLTNKGVKGLKQLISAGALNVDNVSQNIDLDIISAIDANTSGVYASSHYATLGFIMFLIGTTMFVYNYRQKAWSRVVIPSVDDVSKILSMFETSDGYVLMGGYDYLFEFDPTPDTYNFNGVAPVYRWTSSMLKVTTADSMYLLEMILRLASSKAATFTLKTRAIGFDTGVEDQAAFNEQAVSIPAITNNDAVFNFVRIPLFGAGRFVQFDIIEEPNYIDNDDVEIVGLGVSGELGVL